MSARETIRGLGARLAASGAGAVLLRGASVFLVLHVVAAAAGFAVQALLARQMGATGYGTYAFALSWIFVLIPIGRLGLGTSSLRYVAAFAGQERWGELRGFRSFALGNAGGVSLAVAAATVAAAALAPGASPELRTALYVGCVALPVYSLLQIQVPTLRALKQVVLSQIAGSVLPPFVMGAGLLVWWLSGSDRLSPAFAMGLNLAAAGLCLGFASLALGRVLPARARTAPPLQDRPTWWRVTLPLMLVNLVHMLMERTGLLVIGSTLGPELAGIYAPAMRVAVTIAVLLTAVNAWLAPYISELHSQGRTAELQHFVRRGAQLVFAATLPTVLGVVVFGREILGVFGPEFTAGYRALTILAAGQLVDALTGPVGLLMTLTGQQATAARVLVGVTIVHVGLNLVLVPAFGIEGAAVATAASKITWNLIFLVIVWRRLGVRSTLL